MPVLDLLLSAPRNKYMIPLVEAWKRGDDALVGCSPGPRVSYNTALQERKSRLELCIRTAGKHLRGNFANIMNRAGFGCTSDFYPLEARCEAQALGWTEGVDLLMTQEETSIKAHAASIVQQTVMQGSTYLLQMMLTAGVLTPSQAIISPIELERPEAIKICLEKGIDVNDSLRKGAILRSVARTQTSVEMGEFLISLGARIDEVAQNDGMSVLSFAAFANDSRLIQLLLDHGARVYNNPLHSVHCAAEQERIPPIVAAARHGSSRVISLLIRAGADINASHIRDAKFPERNAFWIAANARWPREVPVLLMNAGADIYLELQDVSRAEFQAQYQS